MVSRIRLAPNGPEVSRFAYGAWRLLRDEEGSDAARVRAKIDLCLELGITTFDHADVYGNYGCEQAFGAALRQAPRLRDRMEIVTKCGIQTVTDARPGTRVQHYDYSSAHIVASVERSLTLLHTDHIDVLLLHRPSPMMDPDAIAPALTQLRRAGKLLHAGVSNFTPAQFDMVQSRLDFQLCTNQLEASLLAPEVFLDGSLDHLMKMRIRPMAWSPTAGGRVFSSDDERARRVRAALAELAPKYATSAEALAYAFLLAHPSSMQIVLGTNKLDRIRTAAGSEAVALDLQDWFLLYQAAIGRSIP